MASTRRSSKQGDNRADGPRRPRVVVPTDVSVLSAATGARLDLIGAGGHDVQVTGVTLRGQDVQPGDLSPRFRAPTRTAPGSPPTRSPQVPPRSSPTLRAARSWPGYCRPMRGARS